MIYVLKTYFRENITMLNNSRAVKQLSVIVLRLASICWPNTRIKYSYLDWTVFH